jgi:hypothetical protein
MEKIGNITREQRLQMERKARREAEIDFSVPRVKNTVEKSKKTYNRQTEKNFKKHLDFSF